MSVSVQEDLRALFAKSTVTADDAAVAKLAQLLVLLQQWNRAVNLTAVKDLHDMAVLHILDSAVISPLIGSLRCKDGAVPVNIADVGTGAGFPGLVLAVLNPDKQFTLIDSVGKKLAFVRAAATALKLANVRIVQGRVEELHFDTGFDLIVSRAFAPLERMVRWCLPLLSERGLFVAMKSHLEDEEVRAVPSEVHIERIEPLSVPTLQALRQAVVLSRTAAV